MLKILALLCAATPFVFAMIRAVTTGTDVRYVYLAVAAMAGGMLVSALARGSRTPLSVPLIVGLVLVVSTVLATGVGVLLGTHLGPGLLIVAGGFAVCFAAATWLSLLSRPR